MCSQKKGPKTGLRLQSRDLSSLNKCPVGQCRSPPNTGQPRREASLSCPALPSCCGFIVTRTLPAIFLLLFLSCKFGNALAGKRKCVMNDNADDPGTLSWQEAWPEEGSVSATSGSWKALCPQQNSQFQGAALSSSPEPPCSVGFLPGSLQCLLWDSASLEQRLSPCPYVSSLLYGPAESRPSSEPSCPLSKTLVKYHFNYNTLQEIPPRDLCPFFLLGLSSEPLFLSPLLLTLF